MLIHLISFLSSIENESVPREQAEQMLQDLINDMSRFSCEFVL